jgi:hypothetical protein
LARKRSTFAVGSREPCTKNLYYILEKSQIAPHRTEQIIMHFTIVGTIMLCLMAAVSGSSLMRERGLSNEKKPSPKKKAKTPTPAPTVCSFTDPKKAGALGSRLLAQFWEGIINTKCTKAGINKVFNAFFDENIVFTFNSTVVFTGRDAVKAVLYPKVLALCQSPATYLSWIALDVVLDTVDKAVFTIVTTEVTSVPVSNVTCGLGYSFTAKALGKECATAKVMEITSTLSLTNLPKCPA